MDIPPDKCVHMSLTRMPGPLPLYRCTACKGGFVLYSYLPIPPARFHDVALQFAGSEKLLERMDREIAAMDSGLVLPETPNPAEVRDLNGSGEPLAFDRKRNSTST